MSKKTFCVGLFLMGMALFLSADLPKPTTSGPVGIQGNVFKTPTITAANSKCLSLTGELDIAGFGFGSVPGTKVVQVNGQPLETWIWEPTAIKAGHEYTFPAGQLVTVRLFDTAAQKVVSNEFQFFNFFCIAELKPSGAAKPGDLVTIMVQNDIGTSPAGLVLKMGQQTASIQYWNGHTIKAVVPALPAGNHMLRIKKGARILSNEYPFTVK